MAEDEENGKTKRDEEKEETEMMISVARRDGKHGKRGQKKF